MNLLCEPFPLIDKTRNILTKKKSIGRPGQTPIARTIPINRQDQKQIGKSEHQSIVRTIPINMYQTTDKEFKQLQFKGQDRNLLTEQFL